MRRQTAGGDDSPVLAFELEDPRWAAQVDRWIAELEARAASGKRHVADRLVVLGGWPFLITTFDGELELHALDLTTPSDAPPKYLRHADSLARLAEEQQEVVDSFDLPGGIDPPHYLMKIDVCPHWERTGRYVMARIPTRHPIDSGWALECDDHCQQQSGSEAWTQVTVADLVQRRIGLVRYLALPVGVVVYNLLDSPRFAVAQVSTDTNVAKLPLGFREFRDLIEELPERKPSALRERLARTEPVELDPARDHDVYDAYVSTDAVSVVAERYFVGTEMALEAVDRAWSPEGQRSHARAMFRDELSLEHIAEIELVLNDPDPARWRVQNAAGRKLRELTNRPFAELKVLAQKMDEAFAKADRRAELHAGSRG